MEQARKDETSGILTLKSISKRFPGVDVLKRISFTLEQGRIYGLVGENGAGKSTLVKILMGLFPPEEGEILISGERIYIRDPQQARYEFGIDAVFQEHALIPQMSIAENVFLDSLQSFYDGGFINNRRMEADSREVLNKVGLNLDVSVHASEISEAEKSLVELSKALYRDPKILILDEVTAPLPSEIVHQLFDIMQTLKQAGKTIIFISHRLHEVLTICDEILVLRDGNFEGCIDNTEKEDLAATRKEVVLMMTGTEKGLHFPPKAKAEAREQNVLSLMNLRNSRLRGINLDVYKGEIVALAGLRGQGQSAILRAVAGLLTHVEGDILLEGKTKRIRNPYDAIESGIFYVSDRRDEEELWLTHDVWLNISLASINDRAPFGIIRMKNDRSVIEDMVSNLRIETPSLAKIVQQLSGGNRQKVVLGKYLLARPKILLMDQPTIGLDVGAKVEIYNLLRKLVDEGIPALVVLTDLEEVVSLPDRILVMREGVIAREFSGLEVNEEELVDSYYG
ncbi:MAG TPA: sugar ABC transporter ATP-binding protein [Anaerolineae bacterium]|nr:sugar ABC transporter ATP-binding protein [Anaerolineae bacterium]